MPNCNRILTAVQMRYFLSLGQLEEEEKGVQCSRIAQQFSVSRASVHRMVASLQEKSLVKQEKYGEVFLTREGLHMLELYSEYYRSLSVRMQQALMLSESACSVAVYTLLAELSEETLRSICGAPDRRHQARVSQTG